MSYWGIEPHTFRLQNGRYAWLAYTTNIILICLILPKAGIEPTLDAYEASVLTIELPKLKGVYNMERITTEIRTQMYRATCECSTFEL